MEEFIRSLLTLLITVGVINYAAKQMLGVNLLPVFSETINLSMKIVLPLLQGLYRFIKWVVTGIGLAIPSPGVPHWMTQRESNKLFHRKNQGIIVSDGKTGTKRLSLEDSFKHLMLEATTGAGKSTDFFIKNILLAGDVSLVVTDPSNELYELTSGYMSHVRRFEILKIDISNPDQSYRFNPLIHCIGNSSKLKSLVKTIVQGGLGKNGSGNSRFFAQSAIDLMFIVGLALTNSEREAVNLKSFAYLINRVAAGFDDSLVYSEVTNYIFHHLPSETLRADFIAILNNDERTFRNIISTCRAALEPFRDRNIEIVSGSDNLPLDKLRKANAILYIVCDENDVELYSGYMGLLYQEIFKVLMKEKPQVKEKAVLLLMDEAANITFDSDVLPSTITQIRKYQVSMSLCCQTRNQWRKYGEDKARIITGGCWSRLWYGGIAHDSACEVSSMLGIAESMDSGAGKVKRENLASPQEIRCLKGSIYIGGQYPPARLEVRPYWMDKKYVRMTQYPVHALDMEDSSSGALIDLSAYRPEPEKEPRKTRQPTREIHEKGNQISNWV